MSNDGAGGRLDDDTIDALLDAGRGVREYLSKAVASEPFSRTLEQWEADRPGDVETMQGDDTITAYLNLLEDEFVGYPDVDDLSPVEQRLVDDLRANTYEEIREVQRRLALTPTEFVVYLLSQAAGWSDDEIAAEIGESPATVAERRADARDRFRTAMRMVDLCERVDDPDLADDLAAWRIHRDPLAGL